eukprot:g8950.t1
MVSTKRQFIQKPYFIDKIYHENINVNIIDKLLKSEVLRNKEENTQEREIWDFLKSKNLTDESMQLTKLRNTNGKIKYFCVGDVYGRCFADKGLSLALIRKEIRHTLCKDTYIDWDMVNAHPVILFQLMLQNKPDDDCYWLCLKQYHINREVKLKEVQNIHGVSRGSAKQLFICLINNSSYESWKKREFLEHPCACGSGKKTKKCCNKYNENDEKLGSNTKILFVEDFAKEVKNVIRILKQHNQEMYKEIAEKKKKQKKTGFHSMDIALKIA